jgi:hypothetical protein
MGFWNGQLLLVVISIWLDLVVIKIMVFITIDGLMVLIAGLVNGP